MTDDLVLQGAADDVPELPAEASNRVLHPLERLAEILFGLIMVLVSTGSLSIATADHMEVRTMLVGALGCNLAWGIIDAGLYLMARLHERGRKFLLLKAVHQTTDQDTARNIIADALPPLVASVLTSEQLESIRQKLSRVPGSAARPKVTMRDWVGALGICLLVFLSTFPVAIPFMIISDARLALRVSNAVAIVMLFLCGYLFGQRAGILPWVAGLTMVAVGIGLVGITIRLGG
jgi:VIT1/CCC1 family predicted Fe2+/Mn2+ transporter